MARGGNSSSGGSSSGRSNDNSSGKRKAAGAVAKGILKPLDNVFKDGKRGGGHSSSRGPGGRDTPSPWPHRSGDPKRDLVQDRFDNFRRRVEPNELRGAPPSATGRPAGHADSKHGVDRAAQADILNNPERTFTGYNKNGREVDIYYKDGSVAITEAGKKDSVITAYGKADTTHANPKPVKPEKWADDAAYVEVQPSPANTVIYPNRQRWEEQDWP
ncbi:hypothetical protein ACIA8K_27570 [Catenuloplanes sp. NPDC051500]|uniref:hypothetical protein n=1 Tax=Catenuloplanes sp. NPDC051500 TaxID=3363959 RepID=UPI00378A4835